MEFSSTCNETVHGVVVLVNLYLSKADPELVFGSVQHGYPSQAYIVHSDKQGLRTDVNFWDRQSNSLGLVLASCEMAFASQVDFPRFCTDEVVMHFIANVSVTTISERKGLKCISDFDGPNAEEFFTGVKEAFDCR